MLEAKIGLSVGLMLGGLLSFFFPEFNGFFSDPLKITIAEGRIIGSILFVGGAVLLFMPSDLKQKPPQR